MINKILTSNKSVSGLAALLIICILIPVFVDSPYYLDLFIITLMNAILAITFIMMLRAGLINLGLTAFWGIGAYTSVVLVTKFGLSFWISLPASALVAGIFALGFGYVLIGSGSTGFNFVMLSAVIGMLFTVVVGNISYVGGYSGISNIPAPNPINIPFLPAIDFTSKAQFFYLELFLFVIVFLVCKAFYSAWTGRAWAALSLNPRLASSLGINIFKYKLLAFVLASAIAGMIGCFYAHYEGFVIPDSFGIWQNIYIQIYAILGGMGYAIAGPLVGAAFMTLVPQYLKMASTVAPVFTGAILILAILFLPRGIMGLWDNRKGIAKGLTQLSKKLRFQK